MIPELGNLALALALGLALVQGTLPFVGAARGDARLMALARPVALGQALLVALASAALVQAFVGNDFSVAYVANNSNSRLPLAYRICAVWGGHEGSVLLWIAMLSLWSVGVALFSRSLPRELVARVLGTMGLIGVGFLAFLLFTSNPFARGLPAPADGRDLNPLLQDLGMIAHPPILYMGYVGFSVAFAFAIAALVGGRLDAAWARWTRPWTLAAWSFLTLGIFLGSAWAYYELGWGGWWFWDAVENASFMPWLVGTALVHSLSVTEKRDSFKSWTVLLAILAFSLSLLGTFLVRSGVLTSVHAFASDPQRGLYILGFLAAVIGGALALYAWRAPTVGLGGRFAPFSRESLLLVNNVILAAAAGTVLLGTLYPLALDALGLGKISVGPPYFDAVFVPLAIPLALLTGVGPLLAWKRASAREVLLRLRPVAAGAVAFALLAALAFQASLATAIGVGTAAWLLLATALDALRRLRAHPAGTGIARRIALAPLGWWGMVVAHAGLGVFVLGVTVAKSFESGTDASLRVGEAVTLGDFRFGFESLEKVDGANYVAGRARFEVTRDGHHLATLFPEKRFYVVQQMPMTEAAVDRGLLRDLYVSLSESTPDGAWVVRVQHKPLMGWIWAGALLIAAGGGLAAADRRYRAGARAAASSRSTAPSPAVVHPAPALDAAAPSFKH
ncbi:heme lyase CcmF/NrfE family subunit [Derxia lacustris]|uniref:heme lyase CcmF/NrfE family subunit n=1 Tax=Derxia lacustris TaxID=764842 RepID=UPI000A173CC1|nr:heme lyase CcmF/NrfE family subunit [Derxia lacustris]